MFSSELVGYFCSMFFIVDIVVRYACYTRTQPPGGRRLPREPRQLDFFSKDRMRLLDLVIVVLDGGTVLLLVLAASSSSSSDSLSGLMFAKAGRALRLARLARWLRSFRRVSTRRNSGCTPRTPGCAASATRTSPEVATGSREDGTLHVGAYENARMMFERNRHIVITDDLVQWVKQDSDLPRDDGGAPRRRGHRRRPEASQDAARAHAREVLWHHGRVRGVQFPRTTRWTFFIDLSQSLGILKHRARHHHHRRLSAQAARAGQHLLALHLFFSSASSSADDADSSRPTTTGAKAPRRARRTARGGGAEVNHHSQCYAGLQHRCEIFKIGTTRVSTPGAGAGTDQTPHRLGGISEEKIEEEKELEKAVKRQRPQLRRKSLVSPGDKPLQKVEKKENNASMKSAAIFSALYDRRFCLWCRGRGAAGGQIGAAPDARGSCDSVRALRRLDARPGMLYTCEFMDPNFMVRRRIRTTSSTF